MQAEQVRELVEKALPGAQIEVTIDGSHAHLTVVSEAFEGLRPVKKQQLVYAALSEQVADGRIHAVHMKTLTPAEAAAQ